MVALLRYLAEKAFQGKSDEINEYNIAIEVFGRSERSFDTSRDAIARVEAHRLRKRLKEYYEAEGREHAIVISLPTGNYVPAFTRRDPTVPDMPAPESSLDGQQFMESPSTLDDGSLRSVNLNSVNRGDQEFHDLELTAKEKGDSEQIVPEGTSFQARSPEPRKSVHRLLLFSVLASLGILSLAGL